MADPNATRLKRSYERNLGHSRFWAGVGAALLGAFVLFVVESLWEVGRSPEDSIPVDDPAFTVGALILGIAVASSLVLSVIFRFLYQRDDAALTTIEQENQEATP